jgi:hypothetical protein
MLLNFIKAVRFALCLSGLALLFSGCPPVDPLDGLIVLDGHPGLRLDAISPQSVLLYPSPSAATAEVRPGDILVGSADGGLLRRVLQVSCLAQGVLSITTAPASLSEAVETGVLAKSFVFDTADFIQWGLLPSGDGQLLGIAESPLYRGHGVSIGLSRGAIRFRPKVSVGAFIHDHRLYAAHVTASGDLILDLDIKIAVDESREVQFETDLMPPISKPFSTYIGRVPVTGVARFRFPIGVRGRFDGDTHLQIGFNLSNTFSVGAYYRFGAFEQSSEFLDLDFQGHPPIWNIDAGANARCYVSVVAEVILFNRVTLSSWIGPFVDAEIHAYPPPQSMLLYGGIETGANSFLRVFDWRIFDRRQVQDHLREPFFYWDSDGL